MRRAQWYALTIVFFFSSTMFLIFLYLPEFLGFMQTDMGMLVNMLLGLLFLVVAVACLACGCLEKEE